MEGRQEGKKGIKGSFTLLGASALKPVPALLLLLPACLPHIYPRLLRSLHVKM